METLFELTFQDQTLNPQVGTFTDASQTTGAFTLEDGEYYLTNADTKPPPIPIQLSELMPESMATAYLPAIRSHCSITTET